MFFFGILSCVYQLHSMAKQPWWMLANAVKTNALKLLKNSCVWITCFVLFTYYTYILFKHCMDFYSSIVLWCIAVIQSGKCSDCNVEFGLLWPKRHHCKECRVEICDDCSHKNLQRICKRCFVIADGVIYYFLNIVVYMLQISAWMFVLK